MEWNVYIILCQDKSLYTGITTDVDRRFEQHATGKGARYFYGHKPMQVVYVEPSHTRSSASKRESEIKKLKKADKQLLISSQRNLFGKNKLCKTAC